MSALRRLQGIVQDPLFWRVAVCVFALPFVYLGIAGAIALSPPEGWWWFGVLLFCALGAYGAFLVYASCFGSRALFDRATNFVSEGGDLIGILFVIVVGLVAIPITVLLRWVRPRQNDAL